MALVDAGLAESRQKAQALILAGQVLEGDKPVNKAGQTVTAPQTLRLRGEPMPFVSRGGLKLAKALEVFDINVADRVAVDVGASTGGFTDCLLQNGAARVHCVDVGYGQLAWKIAQDPRVRVRDKTNIRHLDADTLGEPVSLAVVDVSFISLKHVLPVLAAVLVPATDATGRGPHRRRGDLGQAPVRGGQRQCRKRRHRA